MNQCKGTIYYRNNPKFTDQEIIDAINETCEVKVVDIYRMKKRVDSNLVELPIYLLTFQSTILPSFVKIGWTRCSTRTYIPRPRRCYKCNEYGHGIKTCRNPSVCMTCGEACGEENNTHPNPCTSTPKCPNCSGPHNAASKDCPRYTKEQLVLTAQALEGLTYQAARKKVFKESAKKLQNTRPTYAEKTAPDDSDLSDIPPTPSPVIRTNNFRNSTFGTISHTQENEHPPISDSNTQRKRNLSDPTNPDPSTKKQPVKQPKNSNHKSSDKKNSKRHH